MSITPPGLTTFLRQWLLVFNQYCNEQFIVYGLSLSLSHTHTHKHTESYTNTHTNTHTHAHTYTHTVTQTTTISHTREAEGGAYIIRNVLSWYDDVINDITPGATFTPGHSITSCPQLTRTTLLCWAPVTRKYFNVIILAYICRYTYHCMTWSSCYQYVQKSLAFNSNL